MNHPARLLILEDELVIAMLIEETIRNLGHEIVGPFRAIEPAQAAIEAQLPDAALLDLNLGRGATSYPIAARLAAHGVPFMFLTGYGERALDPAFAATPLVSKPFAQDQLEGAVADLLATR